jgi:hypothetical protein
MPNGVEFDGRLAHVGTFPIGIDPSSFIKVFCSFAQDPCADRYCDSQNLEKESVQKRIAVLKQRFNGVKVIIGVDRLDYIKGVPQKLHRLELFLTQHPEWIGRVVQLAVPSRCRGLSKPARNGERACRPCQRSLWNCRVYVNTFHAQEPAVRRTLCAVRNFFFSGPSNHTDPGLSHNRAHSDPLFNSFTLDPLPCVSPRKTCMCSSHDFCSRF